MTTLLKKVILGETSLQKSASPNPSSDRSPSTRSPAGRDSSEDPKDKTIPPEPVQLATEGDFSLNEAEAPLQAHNLARANKRCKALKWDTKLAKDAAAYAELLARTGILEHSGIETAGENLYHDKGEATLEQAVDAWLRQETLYDGKAIGASESGLREWGDFSTLASCDLVAVHSS